MAAQRIHVQRATTGSIAEFGAVLAVVIPLVFLLLFVCYECAYAYMIKGNIDNAAKNAARAMAIAYGQNPDVATNTSLQQNVYSGIRIPNFVNDNRQFDPPQFSPSGGEPTNVTVTLTYRGGQYGLPPFPNPDPLNLSANFKIDATYTYQLEGEY